MRHADGMRLACGVLLLVIVGAAGCAPAGTAGPAKPASGYQTPAVQATAKPTTAAQASQVVPFVAWAADEYDLSALQKAVSNFMAANPDIKIDCTIVMLSGTAPAPAGSPPVCTVVRQ